MVASNKNQHAAPAAVVWTESQQHISKQREKAAASLGIADMFCCAVQWLAAWRRHLAAWASKNAK